MKFGQKFDGALNAKQVRKFREALEDLNLYGERNMKDTGRECDRYCKGNTAY